MYPFTFKVSRIKQETQNQEEMRKITVAEERIENIKSPQGKRCKTLSPSDVSSTGCHPDVVVNCLLHYTLPVNNFEKIIICKLIFLI